MVIAFLHVIVSAFLILQALLTARRRNQIIDDLITYVAINYEPFAVIFASFVFQECDLYSQFQYDAPLDSCVSLLVLCSWCLSLELMPMAL